MDRRRFFDMFKDILRDPADLRRLHVAYWLAKTEHRPQRRDSGERYFEHVREVCLVLVEFGVTDRTAFELALLHDLLEDCWTPEEVLIQLFGSDVYAGAKVLSKKWSSIDLVSGRMNRHKRTDEEYFAGLAEATCSPRLVKLADRIHNLRSCTVWPLAKRAAYAAETRSFLLPIARATDLRLHAELLALVEGIEQEVADEGREASASASP